MARGVGAIIKDEAAGAGVDEGAVSEADAASDAAGAALADEDAIVEAIDSAAADDDEAPLGAVCARTGAVLDSTTHSESVSAAAMRAERTIHASDLPFAVGARLGPVGQSEREGRATCIVRGASFWGVEAAAEMQRWPVATRGECECGAEGVTA